MKSPFKFLDYFDKEDQQSFFGRQEETERLYRLVNKYQLVLLYGPSGTGKTSLIRCGLGNRFDGSDWKPIFINRRQNITRSVVEQLREQLEEEDATSLGNDFVSLTDAVYKEYLRPVYLIFDQLEELFIDGSAEEQTAFTEQIHQLMEAGLACRILFVLREEYLGRLYHFEQRVPIRYEQRLRVDPLTEQVIEKEVIGSSFALFNMKPANDAVLPQILSNLSEDGRKSIALPYLQVYLDRLWFKTYKVAKPTQSSNADNWPALTITNSVLDELGGLHKVFAEYLEDSRDRIQAEIDDTFGQGDNEVVPRFITSLVTEDGTKRSQAIEWKGKTLRLLPPFAAGWKDMDSELLTVLLQKLEYARLIRVTSSSFELAHDSLAGVIDGQRSAEERQLNLLRRQIKTTHDLYPTTQEYVSEKRIALYEDHLEELGLSKSQEIFLQNSKTHWEDQRQQALQRERKKRRRTALFSVGALLLALIAGYNAWDARQKTEVANNAVEETSRANEALQRSERSLKLANERLENESKLVIQQRDSLEKTQAEAIRAKDAALAANVRASALAENGRLLYSTLNNSYDELIASGFREYRSRGFQNALTYWANARFLQPTDPKSRQLVDFVEKSIKANDYAHSGDWDKAEKMFIELLPYSQRHNLNFADTRLRQLAITRKNWANLSRDADFASTDSLTITLPLLSFPLAWTEKESELTYLKFLTMDDEVPFLQRFTSLESLDFTKEFPHHNEVKCSNIDNLKGLVGLKHLNLSACEIQDISPLSNLKNIRSLDLSSTKIINIDSLRHLINLHNLSIFNTQVSDLSPLSNLTSIGDLYLSSSQVSDLSPLSNLTSMGNLNLNGKVSDLSPLSNLTSMGDLGLAGSEVSDLSPLSNLATS